jgi:hypothetical protein
MDKPPMTERSELPEKLTLTQARKYLGISFTKMTNMIRGGKISYEVNPLDLREKLVRRSELDELLRRAARK